MVCVNILKMAQLSWTVIGFAPSQMTVLMSDVHVHAGPCPTQCRSCSYSHDDVQILCEDHNQTLQWHRVPGERGPLHARFPPRQRCCGVGNHAQHSIAHVSLPDSAHLTGLLPYSSYACRHKLLMPWIRSLAICGGIATCDGPELVSWPLSCASYYRVL